jgi:hypothetical protein
LQKSPRKNTNCKKTPNEKKNILTNRKKPEKNEKLINFPENPLKKDNKIVKNCSY